MCSQVSSSTTPDARHISAGVPSRWVPSIGIVMAMLYSDDVEQELPLNAFMGDLLSSISVLLLLFLSSSCAKNEFRYSLFATVICFNLYWRLALVSTSINIPSVYPPWFLSLVACWQLTCCFPDSDVMIILSTSCLFWSLTYCGLWH